MTVRSRAESSTSTACRPQPLSCERRREEARHCVWCAWFLRGKSKPPKAQRQRCFGLDVIRKIASLAALWSGGGRCSRGELGWCPNPCRGGPAVTSGDERKVVTVLFADLAGSTELAQRHDPEQLRQLLSAFFEEMSQQVRSFGGTVEKYAGDAVMAVFGVPRIQENDAERAVRAALAMRESLTQLNPLFEQEYGARLELRVGIATGEVVGATDDRREMLVTGEAVNLAARLQSSSSGIVVSEATHRLLARLLDCRRLDSLTLKGFSHPITAYEVSGLRASESAPRGIPGLSSAGCRTSRRDRNTASRDRRAPTRTRADCLPPGGSWHR